MKQINLCKFAANDPYRPAMNGVFHDEEAQAAVASNAQILVASTGHYDPEKAGQIIDKDGHPIVLKNKEGVTYTPKFPRWRSVIPDIKAGREFPLNDLIQAYQNARNFQKNIPATYEDGIKISRNQRRIYLAVEVQDRGGMYGDSYYIGFTFDLVKLLMLLPQEGAKVYAYGPRRALYWVNESEGLRVIFMPTMIDQKAAEKAGVDGLYNPREEEEKDGMYLGPTIITCDRYGCAGRLFRTPEKPERVPMVKCLGENWLKPGVKLRPEADLVPVEGTASFYKRETVDRWGNEDRPALYKKDSGFMVYCGKAPRNWNGEALEILTRNDPMTYAEMVVANKWNEHPSEHVKYFFQRTGQTMPAYC